MIHSLRVVGTITQTCLMFALELENKLKKQFQFLPLTQVLQSQDSQGHTKLKELKSRFIPISLQI